ncbi:hypothetical protein BH20ACI1_BH20ACI1_27210 [soil metagenome]
MEHQLDFEKLVNYDAGEGRIKVNKLKNRRITCGV